MATDELQNKGGGLLAATGVSLEQPTVAAIAQHKIASGSTAATHRAAVLRDWRGTKRGKGATAPQEWPDFPRRHIPELENKICPIVIE